MIYVDSSVVLAQLLVEDRRPPASLWVELLVGSRLVEYEVWTRIHGRGLGTSHGVAVRDLLGRLAWLEMVSEVVSRARDPGPHPVRTLDALHLASMTFLRANGQEVRLASYDERLNTAARALDFELLPL